ncbi:MAG: ABC transporter transmembrane domain-containing protein, partial [Candidatus Tectomicrobia bacterium]|nr:ABC transporter transmembrane domain-containing protein [Candidatus Tectomicrobia bacterium]
MPQKFLREGQGSTKLTVRPRPEIRLRSAIPGRERWEVHCIHRKPRLAVAIEQRLQQHAGIVAVQANPATGRVLVRYDPSVLQTQVQPLMRDVLDALFGIRPSQDGSRPAGHPLVRLWHTTPSKGKRAWLAPVVSVMNTFFHLLPPLTFVLILSTVISGGSAFLSALGITGVMTQLVFLSALSLTAYGLATLTDHYRKKRWNHLARSVEHDIRLQVFAHMQALDMSSLGDQSTGQMLHLVATDTSQLNGFFENGAHELARIVTTITFLGTVAFILAPSLALVALLPLPLMWWLSRYVNRRGAPAYTRVHEATSDLSHLLASNLSG